MMDIARTDDFARLRSRRRIGLALGGAAILAIASLGVTRLRPAAPVVSRASIWTGRVERGPMLREVRGTGVLTPLEIRWIPAPQAGRVERIAALPGTAVDADTVLLELSNPELSQSAVDSTLAVQAAEAELASAAVAAESQVLTQQSVAASVAAEAEEAERKLRVEEELARQGLTSQLSLDLARTRARDTATRRAIEERRVAIGRKAAEAHVATARSRLSQLRTLAELRTGQRAGLSVRAGIPGVVQQVPVQIGQQVAAGAILAKVAQPERLKAELKIAETQARDIEAGQSVVIDTRNGTVEGRVIRVDPAAQNGTVMVDVSLPADLPKGARPDLSVDGTIRLERLDDVLHLARPMQAEPNSVVNLYKVSGNDAVRVQVRVGRASASAIEIVSGLAAGDEVLLSDTSGFAGQERVRIE